MNNCIDIERTASEAICEYYRKNKDLNGLVFLMNKSMYSSVYGDIMVFSNGASKLYGQQILIFDDHSDEPHFLAAEESKIYYKSKEADCICI